MNHIFIEILNNSLITSLLIIAVIIVRMIIKKAPKWFSCVLWGLVAIKLVFPFSIESVFSLVPSAKPIPSDIEYSATPQIESGVDAINRVVNPVLEQNFAPQTVISINPLQIVIMVCSIVWIAGIIGLLMYSFISYLLLKRKVVASRKLNGNVYVCDEVVTPFILGILRPRIYLPTGISDKNRECILEHEMAHLRRFDHLWKPLGFVILALYWFNPLCWVAYILLCKDIELACDEKVTRDKDKEWKATYCQALLACNTQRRIIAACPVAFGEVSVKDRVKSVLNYKKPAFWIIAIAVVVSVIIAVCFMTNPKTLSGKNENNEITTEDCTKINDTKEVEYTEASEDGAQVFNTQDETANSVDNLQIGTITSSKIKSEVTLGVLRWDMFLHFSGKIFQCDEYVEPKHGFASDEWCALGGIGVCDDAQLAEREVFENGKLTGYYDTDNHMSNEKIEEFSFGNYTGCLYMYELDLFSAAEEYEAMEKGEIVEGDPRTIKHWVAFYTEGEGETLYMQFYNCDYFTKEEALENVMSSGEQN